jgi:hypothetical protein
MVADLMPEAVVDDLEMIKIAEQHGEGLMRGLGGRDCAGDAVVEQAAVRQAGQFVEIRARSQQALRLQDATAQTHREQVGRTEGDARDQHHHAEVAHHAHRKHIRVGENAQLPQRGAGSRQTYADGRVEHAAVQLREVA